MVAPTGLELELGTRGDICGTRDKSERAEGIHSSRRWCIRGSSSPDGDFRGAPVDEEEGRELSAEGAGAVVVAAQGKGRRRRTGTESSTGGLQTSEAYGKILGQGRTAEATVALMALHRRVGRVRSLHARVQRT